MGRRSLLALVILLALSCIPDVPAALRSTPEFHQVYVPLAQFQRYEVGHSNKKACAGCTCEQMALVGAVASYSWYPSGEMCEAGPRYPMAWDVWSLVES